MSGVPLERIAVRMPALFRRARRPGTSGKGVEAEGRGPSAGGGGRAVEAERFEGEVEGIAGHRPEVGVAPSGGAEPRVLQLLVAPECGQAVRICAELVPAGIRRRSEVEERAIGVEHAGTDIHETTVFIDAPAAYFAPASSGRAGAASAGGVVSGRKTQKVAPRRASGFTQMRPP